MVTHSSALNRKMAIWLLKILLALLKYTFIFYQHTFKVSSLENIFKLSNNGCFVHSNVVTEYIQKHVCMWQKKSLLPCENVYFHVRIREISIFSSAFYCDFVSRKSCCCTVTLVYRAEGCLCSLLKTHPGQEKSTSSTQYERGEKGFLSKNFIRSNKHTVEYHAL